MIAEIQEMFANKTPEELKAMSQPLDEETFEELPDAVKEALIRGDDEESGRTLQ